MVHTTRSGKRYAHQLVNEQHSCWGNASEVLHVVLPAFLDHASLLQARLVCHAWCAAFSSSIKQLQLVQPMSASTARKLARKAAAAFPCTSALHIMLYHDEHAELSLDLTADEDAPTCLDATKLDRPEAAAALLRQFSKAGSLQALTLQLQQYGRFSGISKMLPLVPQLLILDLTGCRHESADLLVVAQHLRQLQHLLLHCPAFTTLSGCKKSSDQGWNWPRTGGATCYEPEHIAGLAQLPELRVLECPVLTGGPVVVTGDRSVAHPSATNWLQSIAQLTQLTALHLIQGKGAWAKWPLPTAVVACLSALTGLCHLRTDTGGGEFACCHESAVGAQQARGWAVALAGMQQLTRLEMTRALVCDRLLLVLGGAGLPQLQVLLLDTLDMREGVSSTAAGAAAVAHFPRIELYFHKGMRCKQHLAFFGLPNIKRIVNQQWICWREAAAALDAR